jgi:crotonobetainyl-CoA:carnitine CoA-transferase CaiB-like acyl-CoA transferase
MAEKGTETTRTGRSGAARPPLEGIRVIDFTRVLAGPYLTQLLADFGAEVIKVEGEAGDDTRHYLPPDKAGQSANFMGLNRGKKSIVIDLKTEEGVQAVRRLVRGADVLVENFRPGTLSRLGLGYADLAAENPALIYCSISGYGQTGAYSALAGYDPIIQAETGFMYLTGDSSQPPTRAGGSLIDVLSGAHAGMGILAALHRRAATGEGEQVDVSLYNTAISAASHVYQGVLLTGKNPPRLGNTSFFMCPNGLFDCADGQMMISAGNDRLFRRLCNVLDRSDLPEDPRFTSNRTRLDNVVALSAEINAALSQKPRDYWVAQLRLAGVPGGAVRDPSEAMASEETTASGLLGEVDHPVAGRVQVVGPAVRLTNAPLAPLSPAPTLGQHTDEILGEPDRRRR